MAAKGGTPVGTMGSISPVVTLNSFLPGQQAQIPYSQPKETKSNTLLWIKILGPMHVPQCLNSFPNSHLAPVTQPADTENN